MGCRTEPAAVHIGHVLEKLYFFQPFNFLYNLQGLPQKQIARIYRKNISRLDDFLYTTYLSHSLVTFCTSGPS